MPVIFVDEVVMTGTGDVNCGVKFMLVAVKGNTAMSSSSNKFSRSNSLAGNPQYYQREENLKSSNWGDDGIDVIDQ